MSSLMAQLGVKDESTWATAVVVDRFFEFNSESMQLDNPRIESAGIRTGQRMPRSDRFVINRKGASGSGMPLEVHSKGFGFWLKHMLGAVGTTGPTDSAYVHTGSIGSLVGDSFTAQVGKPFIDSTVQAFTYNGCKLPGWELGSTVDGLLIASFDIDAQNESTAIALATASYPTATELLSFAGGQVTVNGTAVDVTDVSIKASTPLKTDRYFHRNSTLKKEQLETGQREITIELNVEFESLTLYNFFAATTAAGTIDDVVVSWEAKDTVIGAATKPKLVATAAAARFDGSTPPVPGRDDLLTQQITVKVHDSFTLAYTTIDATP